MYTSKWCNENLNASKIEFKFVRMEMKEVIESKSISEFKEEVSDVLYFGYCFIEGKFGISLPMIGAKSTVEKVIDRLEVWKSIFKENNLKFNKKYLIGGSNYMKKDKVENALELARKDQVYKLKGIFNGFVENLLNSKLDEIKENNKKIASDAVKGLGKIEW